MNGQSSGAWDYIRDYDGNFIITALCDDPKEFPEIAIAEVFSGHAKNPEFNARLIAASPEMRIALISAVSTLKATKMFMLMRRFETEHLNEIIKVIDELLDRIDGISGNTADDDDEQVQQEIQHPSDQI